MSLLLLLHTSAYCSLTCKDIVMIYVIMWVFSHGMGLHIKEAASECRKYTVILRYELMDAVVVFT